MTVCGLVAVCGAERVCGQASELPRGFDVALRRLARRGPDGTGHWCSPTGAVVLGHTRLAINDLSQAGAQPMTDASGSVVVVCNGEIYNAPVLRARLVGLGYRFRSRADTEVLVHGYQAWGFSALVEQLRGMFAFVLWDESRQALYAAVDHMGIKPMIWAEGGGVLCLASDCDALRALVADPELDATGLCHVLCLGYCPAPWTVWRGVQKLGPGQALYWRPGARPTIVRTWQPPEHEGPAGAADAFATVWHEVVADHLLADVPLGLLLSGGIDSAVIAVALWRLGSEGRGRGAVPQCFTLALDGPDNEAPVAADLCRSLRLPHLAIPFDASDVDEALRWVSCAYDEPQAFGALLTMVAVSRAVAAHRKAVLAGDGGDEAFGGYAWHRGASAAVSVRADEHEWLSRQVARADASPAVRAAARQALASLSFTHAHLQRVMPRLHPAEAAAILAPLQPRYDAAIYAGWAQEHDRPALHPLRRRQRLDLMTFCAGSVLPKVDRASMAVGLEVRVPMLDRRVLDWSLSQPVDPVETDPRWARPMLRRQLSGVAGVRALDRPKQGFSLRLRAGEGRSRDRLAAIRRGALVSDGVLAPDWERYVGPELPQRDGVIQALWLMEAWYAHRRAGAEGAGYAAGASSSAGAAESA